MGAADWEFSVSAAMRCEWCKGDRDVSLCAVVSSPTVVWCLPVLVISVRIPVRPLTPEILYVWYRPALCLCS